MTDKEAFKEFARGFAFCIAVVGGLMLLVGIFGTAEKKPQEKFKVVDQYGPCEVVRYTDDTNRWHYFLDCK